MLDILTVNKSDLQRAFLEWEVQSRAGKSTRTCEEALKLPAEQIATENSDWVWHMLAAPSTPKPGASTENMPL